jgi:hypothetical protein
LTYVEEMNQGRVLGRSDWKLPGRKALFSLISHVHVNPALPGDHPFTDVFTGYYWTGVPVARLPSEAWYVHLGGGRVFKGMKQGSYMVWPVAGGGDGECAALEETGGALGESRFLSSEETALDRLTGLEWTRVARSEQGHMDWRSALEAVSVINARGTFGHFDWRLPNVRELESLVCLVTHSPALPVGHPFEHVGSSYWTSTTSTYEPSYAWVLHMEDGAVGVGFKQNRGFSLWPVRDGKQGETGFSP